MPPPGGALLSPRAPPVTFEIEAVDDLSLVARIAPYVGSITRARARVQWVE